MIKKIIWLLAILVVIIQFFRPEKNYGDINSIDNFLSETNPPDNVKVILKESCFDCHSDYTRYPWYNNITPVNYWLQHHIEEGQEHFNVSEWNTYTIKKKDHKLEELIEEVEGRKMPLNSYTWMHSNAQLSEEQIKEITEWAKSVRDNYSL